VNVAGIVTAGAAVPVSMQTPLRQESRERVLGLPALYLADVRRHPVEDAADSTGAFRDPLEVVRVAMHFSATGSCGGTQSPQDGRRSPDLSALAHGHANPIPTRSVGSGGRPDEPEGSFGVDEPGRPRAFLRKDATALHVPAWRHRRQVRVP